MSLYFDIIYLFFFFFLIIQADISRLKNKSKFHALAVCEQRIKIKTKTVFFWRKNWRITRYQAVRLITLECCVDVGVIGGVSSTSTLPAFGNRCSCTDAKLLGKKKNFVLISRHIRIEAKKFSFLSEFLQKQWVIKMKFCNSISFVLLYFYCISILLIIYNFINYCMNIEFSFFCTVWEWREYQSTFCNVLILILIGQAPP